MFILNKLFGDVSIVELLIYMTIIQLWWIAIWGIAYIVIEYISNKSKLRELYLYLGLLITILIIIIKNPHLINHL